jgi:hypothetical protein
MLPAWLPKVLLPALIVLVLVLFRRVAPPRGRMVRHQWDESQVLERLPSGTKDVILDFADGRRLRANQIGDGGTDVRNDVMELLILKTDLPISVIRPEADLSLLARGGSRCFPPPPGARGMLRSSPRSFLNSRS